MVLQWFGRSSSSVLLPCEGPVDPTVRRRGSRQLPLGRPSSRRQLGWLATAPLSHNSASDASPETGSGERADAHCCDRRTRHDQHSTAAAAFGGLSRYSAVPASSARNVASKSPVEDLGDLRTVDDRCRGRSPASRAAPLSAMNHACSHGWPRSSSQLSVGTWIARAKLTWIVGASLSVHTSAVVRMNGRQSQLGCHGLDVEDRCGSRPPSKPSVKHVGVCSGPNRVDRHLWRHGVGTHRASSCSVGQRGAGHAGFARALRPVRRRGARCRYSRSPARATATLPRERSRTIRASVLDRPR